MNGSKGEELPIAHWPTAGSVELQETPEYGQIIICRETPNAPLVTYHNGSVIDAEDLNESVKQNLYICEELLDQLDRHGEDTRAVWTAYETLRAYTLSLNSKVETYNTTLTQALASFRATLQEWLEQCGDAVARSENAAAHAHLHATEVEEWLREWYTHMLPVLRAFCDAVIDDGTHPFPCFDEPALTLDGGDACNCDWRERVIHGGSTGAPYTWYGWTDEALLLMTADANADQAFEKMAEARRMANQITRWYATFAPVVGTLFKRQIEDGQTLAIFTEPDPQIADGGNSAPAEDWKQWLVYDGYHSLPMEWLSPAETLEKFLDAYRQADAARQAASEALETAQKAQSAAEQFKDLNGLTDAVNDLSGRLDDREAKDAAQDEALAKETALRERTDAKNAQQDETLTSLLERVKNEETKSDQQTKWNAAKDEKDTQQDEALTAETAAREQADAERDQALAEEREAREQADTKLDKKIFDVQVNLGVVEQRGLRTQEDLADFRKEYTADETAMRQGIVNNQVAIEHLKEKDAAHEKALAEETKAREQETADRQAADTALSGRVDAQETKNAEQDTAIEELRSAIEEAGQNAFSNVTDGTNTAAAASKTDTLTVKGENGVTAAVDAASKTLTVSADTNVLATKESVDALTEKVGEGLTGDYLPLTGGTLTGNLHVENSDKSGGYISVEGGDKSGGYVSVEGGGESGGYVYVEGGGESGGYVYVEGGGESSGSVLNNDICIEAGTESSAGTISVGYNQGDIYVGSGGTGTLTVGNATGTVDVANTTNGLGHLNVGHRNGYINVGDAGKGTGTLTVGNGMDGTGTLTVGNGMYGTGTLTVGGMYGTGTLTVGDKHGTGTLTVGGKTATVYIGTPGEDGEDGIDGDEFSVLGSSGGNGGDGTLNVGGPGGKGGTGYNGAGNGTDGSPGTGTVNVNGNAARITVGGDTGTVITSTGVTVGGVKLTSLAPSQPFATVSAEPPVGTWTILKSENGSITLPPGDLWAWIGPDMETAGSSPGGAVIWTGTEEKRAFAWRVS